MSADGTGRKGVTNHAGEIFTGEWKETHAGLIVCDGAAMPAALGVNPFATITAFAERSAEQAARRLGLEIDYETKNGKCFIINICLDWSADKLQTRWISSGHPAHPLPLDTGLK